MNTPNNNAVKSPYFRNAREADAFEDKVNLFRDKPHAIAIGFDADPNEVDCSFEIATKQTETEGELLSSLVYVITEIARKHGLMAKITFAPVQPPKELQVFHAPEEIGIGMDKGSLTDEQVDQVVDHLLANVQEIQPVPKVHRIIGFFRKRPPENPTPA